MKFIFSTCLLLLQAWALGQNVSPVDYVNPLMGNTIQTFIIHMEIPILL